MFRNYFIVAVRNLFRQKLYTAITVFGLSLGLAGSLLIGLFLIHEWSFDRFHEHAHDIYQVIVAYYNNDGTRKWSALHPLPMIKTVDESIPGISGSCGFIKSDAQVSINEYKFNETIALVTPGFLKIFSFPLLAGDSATVLKEPQNAVICESLVKKLFGDVHSDFSNVLGKRISLGHFWSSDKYDAVISGVLKDIPINSSLVFSILMPIENWVKFPINNMHHSNTSLYIFMDSKQSRQSLETAISKHAQKFDYGSNANNPSIPEKANDKPSIRLLPLTESYLSAPIDFGYTEVGNPTAMMVLALIAVFILVVACSNFVTISIGRSINRSLEVGIRKVLGTGRIQLMMQFWGEALLLSSISMALGLALTELFLPTFNILVRRSLPISLIGNWRGILVIIGLMAIVGLTAGLYPAVLLSRFQPARSLMKQKAGKEHNMLIRFLVMAQYAISVMLLICTLIIVEQHRYINDKNLGYDKKNVVVVEASGSNTKAEAVVQRYKTAVIVYNKVVGATISDRTFTSGRSMTDYKMPDGTSKSVRIFQIDRDYLNTMKIPLVAGRNFSQDYPSDAASAVLVNETLVKTLELKGPVGKILNDIQWDIGKPIIIGVVKDFHIDKLQLPIAPLIMRMKIYGGNPSVMIRIRPDDIPGTILFLRKTWESVAPNLEFRQSFLDGNIERQYQEEIRWRNIVGYGELFAIVISSMGLFGLVALATARRTKEIGIRKALGSSISGIVYLLLKEFGLLIIASNVIAWPIAYYAMSRWLQTFAYRINLSPWIFILAGIIALLIALVTVSFQAIKAARANPVEALRYE